MAIDLRLIRHAAALAEHGSFSRAADALGIAQPTLSRSIKDLESDVGLQLFTRQRHGIEPTDFGYLFLRQAAMVSAQVVDLEREVALAKGLHQDELAVGFGPYAAECLLPHTLPHFVSAHPTVRLRIQVDSLEVLGRALRQRTLDLVVGESTILDGEELIELVEPLSAVKGYLFARASHPLASRHVSLRDVLEYPLVQISRLPPRVLKPYLDALGGTAAGTSRPVPAIDCPTVPLGVATVIGSDAVMLASLGMVRRELALRQIVPILHESWMHTSWSIMQLRYRSASPSAAAFLHALRAAHKATLAEEVKLEQRWCPRVPTNTAVSKVQAKPGKK